ncbi:hypothetical protein GHT09_007062 [Marmota monax]|uniref:Uncharacterized protein n=1 Tax=Marmota monax TaxID=9995 RepID=A0A834QPB2_MARMO|nr:hypothetical protein GHT09_007062 [Marmota monax]
MRFPPCVKGICDAFYSNLWFLLPSRAIDCGEEADQHGGVPARIPRRLQLVRSASPALRLEKPLKRAWRGAGARGRGHHGVRPVPTRVTCQRESRARAAANRWSTLYWERGGCGERRTETGDVFKPSPDGVSGGCSGDEDNDSDGHAESLVQGVNPPVPAVPRVRAGEGGVATGEEEGGARFRACPRRLGGDPSVPRCSRLPSPEQGRIAPCPAHTTESAARLRAWPEATRPDSDRPLLARRGFARPACRPSRPPEDPRFRWELPAGRGRRLGRGGAGWRAGGGGRGVGLGAGVPCRRSRNMAGPAELVRASVRGPRGRCRSAAAGPGGVGRDGGAPAAARSRRHPRGVRGCGRVATDPLARAVGGTADLAVGGWKREGKLYSSSSRERRGTTLQFCLGVICPCRIGHSGLFIVVQAPIGIMFKDPWSTSDSWISF